MRVSKAMNTRDSKYKRKIEALIDRTLIGSYLTRPDVDWKGTYRSLQLSLPSPYPFLTPPKPAEVLYEILLEIGKNPYHDDRAIRRTCNYSNVAALRLLLSDDRSRQALKESNIITVAATSNLREHLRLLLEHGAADPTRDDNLAYRYASYLGLTETVALLAADPRVQAAMTTMTAGIPA